MRKFLVLAVAMLSLTSLSARAQDADAIENVITQQLDAFTDRDVESAWQYASPMIKGIFGNAANFGAMVQRGYPMVWDNADATFLELRSEAGVWRQTVMIRDPNGAAFILDYEMIETPEGWQINGVQVIPAPDLSA